MKRSMIAVLLLASSTEPTAATSSPMIAKSCERIFFGTQESAQGVFGATLDRRTGRLSPLRLEAALPRPTWLLADSRRPLLYATSDPRDQPGAGPLVVAYAIDPGSGALSRIGAVEPGGQGPTYLSLDERSRTLFVAHYGSGQVSALPLDRAGQPLPAASLQTDIGTGPSPRQKSPHAHAAVPDPTGRFLLAPDLGADRIFVYRFDRRSRMLTPASTPFLQLPPGTGPRHLVFAPDGQFAYLVSELSAEVWVLRWNAVAGTLQVESTLSIGVPDGPRSASEIAISPDGAYLYVGDRATDGIVVFAIDRRNGAITEVQRAPVGGRTPWSFALSPDAHWIVVTNQASDSITVLPRNRITGRLAPAVDRATLSKPVSVAFSPRSTRC